MNPWNFLKIFLVFGYDIRNTHDGSRYEGEGDKRHGAKTLRNEKTIVRHGRDKKGKGTGE